MITPKDNIFISWVWLPIFLASTMRVLRIHNGNFNLTYIHTYIHTYIQCFFLENSAKWIFLVLRGGKVNLVCSILCTSNTGFFFGGGGGVWGVFPPEF